ncbi:MAG: glycine cleavage system protein H [Candidatus Brocadiia bacterium]
MIPDDLFYTNDHVWVRPEEDYIEVGVTRPLIKKLEPLISVDLLEADDAMKMQVPFGVLEGHEETYYLYPPVEERIIEVNDEVLWIDQKLMEDPYGEGWLIRVESPETPELLHLMTSTAYAEFCAEDLGEEYVDD